MTTRLRTLLLGVGWAVLIGLVGLLVAAVFVPRLVGGSVFTVLSPSMQPALDPGSLVVTRPVDPDDVGVNSVITFQLESGEAHFVTHRVVKQGIDKSGNPVFLTEGDANNAPDAVWVRPEQVRGAVWYQIPYIGYLSNLVPADVRPHLVAGSGAALLAYAGAMFLLTVRDRRRVSHA